MNVELPLSEGYAETQQFGFNAGNSDICDNRFSWQMNSRHDHKEYLTCISKD
jgi:hypothetical protein